MSNVERKPRKFKIFISLSLVSLLILGAMLLLRKPVTETNKESGMDFPFESLKIEYEKGGDAAFSVK